MLPDTDVIGMTGKFHKSWGEFGGFKNPDALRVEVAQIVMLGCKACVGDQLHPGGKMDEETYRIIGKAYKDVEEREEWLAGASPVADVAVLAQELEEEKGHRIDASEAGACRMLAEYQVPHAVIDETMDFAGFKILVLPDHVLVDAKLAGRLRSFIDSGGSLILSGDSGLDPDKKGFAVDVGVDYAGPSPWDVEYIAVRDSIAGGLVRSPFLVYAAGITSRIVDGEVLADTWQPYFNRTYEHFCSHRNTPPEKKADHPAIVRKGNVIHMAQPLFGVYYEQGMQLHRDLFKNCFDLLYDDPLLEVDLLTCGRASIMEQKARGRLMVHLMYLNPIRRGAVEVIEDIIPFYDVKVSLRSERAPLRIYMAPSRKEISFTYSDNRVQFTVDKIEISSIAVIEYGKQE